MAVNDQLFLILALMAVNYQLRTPASSPPVEKSPVLLRSEVC